MPGYRCPVPAGPWEAGIQGNWLAAEERRRLGLGLHPIGCLEELIHEQGSWSAVAELPDAMSGLLLKNPHIGIAIIVNAGYPPARRRFSFAHEYAHALADGDRTVSVSCQNNAHELVEKRANAFAAAFLMPEEGVRDFLAAVGKDRASRQVGTVFNIAEDQALEYGSRVKSVQPISPHDAAFMAHHFGVSYQVAVFRMRSLRMLSSDESEDLMRPARVEEGRNCLKLFNMHEEKREDHSGPRNLDLGLQVAHTSIEAYRRELISAGRLREIARKIGVSGSELVWMAGGTRAE